MSRRFKTCMVLSIAALLTLGTASIWASGGNEQVVEQSTTPQFAGIANIDYSKAWELGKKGGRFVIALSGSGPKTFNIGVAAESTSMAALGPMYVGLIRKNQITQQWEPALAESWTISSDQKTMTFKLRPGLKWSDGTPLTADDFAYSETMALTKGVQSNWKSSFMVGGKPVKVIAVDPLTVKIELPSVYISAFYIAAVPPVPKHIFKPILDSGVDKFNSFWGVDTDVTKVVGDGPFVMKQYIPGQKLVMVPNPYYYEKDKNGVQLPYIDEYDILYVPDADTILEKFLSGETDAYNLRGEDYAVLKDKQQELGFKLYNVGANTATVFITFNMNPITGPGDKGIKPPQLTWLSNTKFRQAIAHLVDRKTMINNIMYGFGYPQYSFVPRTSPYYWKGVDAAAFKYDPEKAKALLDEIGYTDKNGDGWRQDPDGNKITLTLACPAGSGDLEKEGQLIAQDAQAIGLDINYKSVDTNTLVTQLVSTYDWEMIGIGFGAIDDPIAGYSNIIPSNTNLHLPNPNQKTPATEWEKQADAAWEQASVTLDPNQTKAGLETIQKIWAEQVPWVYTVSAAIIQAYKTKWGNIYPQAVGGASVAQVISRIYLK